MYYYVYAAHTNQSSISPATSDRAQIAFLSAANTPSTNVCTHGIFSGAIYLLLPMKSSFIIAESCPIAMHGVRDWTERSLPDYSIAEARSFKELNRALADRRYDLIVFDLELNDINSYQTIKRIKRLHLATRILVFSSRPGNVYAKRFIRVGANGFVSKQATQTQFVAAVQKVLASSAYMSDLEWLERDCILDLLSNNELEVGRMLAQGATVTEIAKALRSSVSTISTYKTRMLRKLHIKRLPQLIEIMIKHGIQFPDIGW